ncbi:hypothetical protein D3C81_1924930 [compost metagenome]
MIGISVDLNNESQTFEHHYEIGLETIVGFAYPYEDWKRSDCELCSCHCRE